ncbi:MAG: hypothetical protein M3N48_09020 [Verrucomicrobiota bacterium]|nr:hypothetical protein [Verrucomicrobiota bacterium]
MASRVWQRHGLLLGLLALVLLKLWLVHTEEIYGSATEHDALLFLNAAKHWYWGSEYSWNAFVRPPAYPLFIAFLHVLHIPLRIGIELMQAAAYLALVAGLRKAGVSRAVCLLSYTAMSFHPGSFQLNSVTMADNFYAAVLPLALGGLLLTLFTAKPIHALWTGIAFAVLSNTREESILIPPLLAVFFVLALIRQRSVTGSWKPAIRYWLKPAGAMIGVLCVLNLAVDAANYRAFLGFSKSELTASSFRAAYKALLRIKPDRDQRFVSLSTDAFQKAYSASPTFSQLRPQLEGELGRNWQVPAFTTLGVHEIGTPWILWALRSAAHAQKIHTSAASARRFYRNVAKEINRACDEGRIPSRFVVSSLLDPNALANLGNLPESFQRIAALFLLQYHTMEGRDDAILTEAQRALYDEMTGRGPPPGPGETMGISAALENFIGSYHRFLVIGLSIAGLAAGLTICWRFRQFRANGPLSAALILLGAAIFMRVLLFTFLDATWWIGGYERYLFPVLPLYSCFLILLIRQAIVLPRRGGQAT